MYFRAHKLASDFRGKVPFAFVAVLILALSVISVVIIARIDIERTVYISRRTYEDISEVGLDIEDDLETQAYYITLEVIEELTQEHEPDLSKLDPLVRERFGTYLAESYPREIDVYLITIDSYKIYVIIESWNTTDIVKTTNLTLMGDTHIIMNELHELELTVPGWVTTTPRMVYFRVVGKVTYTITDRSRHVTIEKIATFDKNVYSPLALLKSNFDAFQAEAKGEFSELGRIVKYILTTIAQYRVLCGFAGGGYGGEDSPDSGFEVKDVIREDDTKNDVEVALNLALLLMEARYFRTYDKDVAEEIKDEGAGESIVSLLDNYLNNGTIDAADVIALYHDFENQVIDVGKIFGQSIYSFADRFVYELLKLFWNEEWEANSDTFFDPTLAEPIVNWEEIESRSDVEQWCRERLWHWLGVFGKWLGFTDSGDETGTIVRVTAQEEEAIIKDIYSRYVHPPTPHVSSGVPPAKPTPANPVPGPAPCTPPPPVLYNPNDYYLVGMNAYHVDGRYYLFGDTADSTSSNKKWHVRTYIRSEEMDPGALTDIRYLMLGEAPSVNGAEGRPYTYKLVCWDDWDSGVGEMTYEYYMVKESLIEKHRDYVGTGGPYYNTFRFIIDALTRSMNKQPEDINDVNAKGMVDYAAYDTELHFEDDDAELTIDPKDTKTILSDELKRIIVEDGGAINDAIIEFTNYASEQKEHWFQQGAYLYDPINPESAPEYYLYDLIKETVDLWYETMVNLYDGGYRAFDEDCSSMYSPADGPEHWNNYDYIPNSELPPQQYQTSNHETEAASEKLAGSFKFRNDALRDCYYRVMQIVLPRAATFDPLYWEDLASAQFTWTYLSTDPDGYHYYAWVLTATGIAAVPPEDQLIIPPEVYDGTGTAEDYTPLDDVWKEPSDAYAEPIWDIVKTGISGKIHLANEMYGVGIQTAIGNCVGWSGWAETTNPGLLDDIRAEFIDTIDTVTDAGTYGTYNSGAYDFGCNFYNFVRSKIGTIFIGSGGNDALWDLLAEENGWLDYFFTTAMYSRLADHVDLANIEILQQTQVGVPYTLWKGDYESAKKNKTLMEERIWLDQPQGALDDDKPEADITIKVDLPTSGVRFVDAQDVGEGRHLGMSPFITIWNISVAGSFELNLRTQRHSLPAEGAHKHTWYNATIEFECEFPVVVYSAWDLESYWHADDIRYKMCRAYFNVHDEDTIDHPFFISEPFNKLIAGFKDTTDWLIDNDMKVYNIISNLPDICIEKKLQVTDAVASAYTHTSELLQYAVESTDYLVELESIVAELEAGDTGDYVDNYEFQYFGLNWSFTQANLADIHINNTNKGAFLDYKLDYDGKIRVKPESHGKIGNFTWREMQIDSAENLFYSGAWESATTGTTTYKYTIEFKSSEPVESEQEVSIETEGYGRITNVFVPNLCASRNIDIGIMLRGPGPVPTSVKDAIATAIEDTAPDSMESMVSFVKVMLGYIYNHGIPELTNKDEFGVFWDLETPDTNLHWRYTLYIDTVDESALKSFLIWTINLARVFVYNLGNPQLPSSAYATLPIVYGENINIRVTQYIEAGNAFEIVMVVANIPGESVPVAVIGAGVGIGKINIELATATESSGTTWQFYGKMEAYQL